MLRIEHLQAIKEADKAYYSGKPFMTDAEYDALRKEYIKLYGSKDLDYVPGIITTTDDSKKYKHTSPITSLGKVDESEVDKLTEYVEKLRPIVVEPKLDGASVVVYPSEDGPIFTTRGSGTEGEILDRFPATKEQKENFKSEFPIRGEVVMTFKNFDKMNSYLMAAGKKPMANPRNSVTGILLAKEDKDNLVQYLSFIAYDVIGLDVSENEKLKYILDNTKFEIVEPIICSCKDSSREIAEKIPAYYGQFSDFYGFPIDGLVIKTNQTGSLKKYGSTGHHPKNAIAWKPSQEVVKTVLKNVHWQMGKSGALTPVAEVEPVEILGSTVSKASLVNMNIINKLGLRIGDTIGIIKAKMIIPQIITVFEHDKNNSFKIAPPDKCPFCGATHLTTAEINGSSEVEYYCENPNCSEHIAQQMAFLAKKNVLNIDGLSIETCRLIMQEYKLNSPYDVLELTTDDLLKLPRFGEKKAANIYNAIQKAKATPIPFINWVPALLIDGVGHSVGKLLLEHYERIGVIYEAIKECGRQDEKALTELTEIKGIGTETCSRIIFGGQFIKNWDTLDKYFAIENVKIKKEEKKNMNNNIAGKKFVLTGKMEQPRSYYVEIIVSNGGEVQNAVNKKTDYLISAATNTVKAQKAAQLGIKVITPKEFLALSYLKISEN